ncbi:deoxynucleoside kinase [Rhodovulum sp. MB263]|uniref:deoxynucleoside kinase n=1 Tax=Rhodovulum sp. (strain MB263) TaxID=308754 RepID=UPI0009B77DA6|nr:deoxynucleoside kinase [Rhodovulum sp. MB263]ARC88520.1 hypothetical protein B5V46_07780 [Rhodovulum sp. MB263]
MIVQLSGPTGSGKSTAANVLHDVGFSIIRERYANSSPMPNTTTFQSYSFQIQKGIMVSRLESLCAIKGTSLVVIDRSVDEDFHVFCRLFHLIGLLNDEQILELFKLYSRVKRKFPQPDRVFFFSAPRDALRERLCKRGEGKLILDTIDLQLDLYREWRQSAPLSFIDLDTSRLSLDECRAFMRGAINA